MSRHRSLPRFHRDPFRDATFPAPAARGEVALLADTFGRWFEPETLRSAVAVLNAAGYAVHVLRPRDGGRPLCCGRTFLAAGLVEEARAELSRLVEAALPFARRGVPVVGLEPSCLLTLRDEAKAILPGEATEAVAAKAVLFEELVVSERAAGRMQVEIGGVPWKKALLHGHCHQKALGAFPAVETMLRLIPGLEVATVQTTCCGMGGAFGYAAEHHEISMRIGEMGLFPAVRAAEPETVVVADGTSCRHQIRDGTSRSSVHSAVVLRAAVEGRSG